MQTGHPSQEGARRYPPEGLYISDSGSSLPCTCKPICRDNCAGECGCGACSRNLIDYLRLTSSESEYLDNWVGVADST
jgi:hypothetical protein